MKCCLVCLPLFLAISSLVKAEVLPPGTPLISVTGTAITEVKPDQLLWSIEVRNTGPDLPKVADRHSALASTVFSVLKQLGIEDKNVQTTDVELGPNRVYRHNETVDEGYYAATSVSFKLTDLARYRDVWLRLANLGNVSVKRVTFDHSKRIDITRETRTKALHAAKDKAIAMAEALDAKVGEVLSITEEPVQSGAWIGNNTYANGVQAVQQPAGDADTGGGSVAPGIIPVRVRVVVAFRLLNGGK